MIHVVTAANRALYRDQLDEMHAQRWRFYIEERGWSSLQAKQSTPGRESDEFDDERAVYLMSLSASGAVQGSMRLRPTDDRSLLFSHYPTLVAPETGVTPRADIWEITRLMRAPEFRGSDGALRLTINCAACEFAMTRSISRYVAVTDTFLIPAARALNRNKHRVLGLPQDYAEGEMIAIELTPDAEWLAMARGLAQFEHPIMFELPPPGNGQWQSPMQAERLARLARTASPDTATRMLSVYPAQGAAGAAA